MNERFWEIDFLRGIAAIAMIAFHFLFDLNYFKGYSFDLDAGVFWGIGRFAGTMFLLLVGVSLTLSHNKAKKGGKESFSKYFNRGTRIFSYGLLITLATFMFFPQGTIFFGVLHLIGVSIVLSFPFLERKNSALAFGLIAFAAGIFLYSYTFSFPWLLWLGFFPENLYTFDYYPVLPWFGAVLFGIFLGNTLYPKGTPLLSLPDFSSPFPIRQICFLGRKSLPLYLLHQFALIPLILLFF